MRDSELWEINFHFSTSSISWEKR